jgi:hypothetical protein
MDVGVAGLKIKEACVEGRDAQCRRARYVESGRLVGGVTGAAIVGKYGAEIARSACKIVFAVRLKERSGLACGIIGGAAGGYLGGSVFGEGGAFLGGQIIENDGVFIFQPEGA